MPHLHEQYDFVVSAFVVHDGKVLLIHHKSYNKWLPLGGHIEMDEDPEQALYREIDEESGLKVRVLAEKPKKMDRGVKPILRPAFLDVHPIRGRHQHIAFIYFAVARSPRVRLCVQEHDRFRWFSKKELGMREYGLMKTIRFYAEKSLEAARKDARARNRKRSPS